MNKSINTIKAIKLLGEIFDRIEGEYSNIPSCCIDSFVSGRVYQDFKNTLSIKDQKKLSKWGYVPCDECFKNDSKNEIHMNGTSELGQIVLSIQKLLINRK